MTPPYSAQANEFVLEWESAQADDGKGPNSIAISENGEVMAVAYGLPVANANEHGVGKLTVYKRDQATTWTEVLNKQGDSESEGFVYVPPDPNDPVISLYPQRGVATNTVALSKDGRVVACCGLWDSANASNIFSNSVCTCCCKNMLSTTF